MSDDFKVTDKRGQASDEKHTNGNDEQNPDQNLEIGFSNLIISLGTSAMIHMGVIEDPQTHKKEKNLEMARQEIDLIAVLEAKTKGNLTEVEKNVVNQVLYEVRLRFVEASK